MVQLQAIMHLHQTKVLNTIRVHHMVPNAYPVVMAQDHHTDQILDQS